VMRNVLEPETINIQTQDKVRSILASPPRQWSEEDGMAKAAYDQTAGGILIPTTAKNAAELAEQRRLQRLAEMPPPPPPPAGGDPMAPAPGGDPMAPPGGEEKDPLEDLEGEIEKYVLNKIKKKLQDKMTEEVSEDAASDPELATSSNENINHQANKKYAGLVNGTQALLRIARTDIELLDGIARLESSYGVKVSRDLYRTALKVGSTDEHESLEKYLRRCAAVLTRQPNVGEAKTLVRLGRILSLRKKSRF